MSEQQVKYVPNADGSMPIMSHFGEMRKRLLRAVLAVAILAVVVFLFRDFFLGLFTRLLPEKLDLIALGMIDAISIAFTVSLTMAVIFASPYIFYQLFAFIKPALTDKEKRVVYLAVPFVSGLFLLGVSFAYFIALPFALEFLAGFGTNWVDLTPTAKEFINLVLRVLLLMGLVFEMPIAFMVLAHFGIVKKGVLNKYRRIMIVVAFVLGALITPTIDPISQTVVACAIYALYEFSIVLVSIAANNRQKRLEKELLASM